MVSCFGCFGGFGGDRETIKKLERALEEHSTRLTTMASVNAQLTTRVTHLQSSLATALDSKLTFLNDKLNTLEVLSDRVTTLVATTDTRLGALDKEVSAASVSAAASPFPFPQPNIIPSEDQLKPVTRDANGRAFPAIAT